MGKRDVPEINAGSMADIAFLLLVFFLVTTTIDYEKGQETIIPKKKDEDTEVLPPDVPVPAQNLLRIKANGQDRLLIKKKTGKVEDIYDLVKIFYSNHTDVPNPGQKKFPVRKEVSKSIVKGEKEETDAKIERYESQEGYESLPQYRNLIKKVAVIDAKLELLANLPSRKYYELPESAFIIFESDKSTSYGFYISIRDEIQRALTDIRNEYCQDRWGEDYLDIEKKSVKELGDDYTYRNKVMEVRLVYPTRIVETMAKPANE